LPLTGFNQWLSIDPTNGVVIVSFYDTRNDTTGSRYMTDIYLSRSSDGGASYASNVRASDVSSKRARLQRALSVFGDQLRQSAGRLLRARGPTVVWPIRSDRQPAQSGTSASCTRGLMEEVFHNVNQVTASWYADGTSAYHLILRRIGRKLAHGR